MAPAPRPSEALEVAFAIVPKIPALLSVMGSTFIVYDAMFRRAPAGTKKTVTSYHRLLVSMSVCDILSSAALFLSTWPVPSDTPFVYQALGTTQTCTAQGFFVQIGNGTVLFNGALSVFYLLTIRDGWKPGRMSRRVEPWLHALPLVFTFGTAAAGIVLGLYNYARFTCYIVPMPFTCSESWQNVDGGIPCVRGENATAYNWAFNVVPKAAVLVLVTVIMWLCHRAVVRLERASDRSTFHRGGGSPVLTTNEQEDFLDNDRDRDSRHSAGKLSLASLRSSAVEYIRRGSSFEQNKDTARSSQISNSKRVARQSFLYVGALYITLLPGIINRLTELISGKRYPALAMIIALLMPLQGFWNALIYLRPRYLRAREEQKRRDRRQRVARELQDQEEAKVQGADKSPWPEIPKKSSSSGGVVAVIQAVSAAIVDVSLEDDDVGDGDEGNKDKRPSDTCTDHSQAVDHDIDDIELARGAVQVKEIDEKTNGDNNHRKDDKSAAVSAGHASEENCVTINVFDNALAPLSDLSRSSFEPSWLERIVSLVEEENEDGQIEAHTQSNLGRSLTRTRKDGEDTDAGASVASIGTSTDTYLLAVIGALKEEKSRITAHCIPRSTARVGPNQEVNSTGGGEAFGYENADSVVRLLMEEATRVSAHRASRRAGPRSESNSNGTGNTALVDGMDKGDVNDDSASTDSILGQLMEEATCVSAHRASRRAGPRSESNSNGTGNTALLRSLFALVGGMDGGDVSDDSASTDSILGQLMEEATRVSAHRASCRDSPRSESNSNNTALVDDMGEGDVQDNRSTDSLLGQLMEEATRVSAHRASRGMETRRVGERMNNDSDGSTASDGIIDESNHVLVPLNDIEDMPERDEAVRLVPLNSDIENMREGDEAVHTSVELQMQTYEDLFGHPH